MSKIFPILAIESSGELCSVALILDGTEYSEISIRKKHIHSEKLLYMIDQVLNSLNVDINDVAKIAVSIGPGSFTGLRIGLATAKGLAFGASVPIVPVPTIEAIALQICSTLPVNINFAIGNKVNVDELYFAKFKTEKEYYSILENTVLIDKKDFNSKIITGEIAFGNHKPTSLLSNYSSPNAVFIGKWSYIFGEDLATFDYDYLEPNYLKQFKVRVNK